MLSPRLMRHIRPILVALMFACIAESVAQFIRAFIPAWNAAYAVVSVFLISLEAFYADRLVRRLHLSGGEWWRFRFAEWVVILLVLKLLSYAARGWADLRADFA